MNILSVKLTKNDDDRAILCYTLFIFNVFSYMSLTRSLCRCVSNIRANFNFVFFSIATSYLHTFLKFTRSARSCVCIRQWRACVLVISFICYLYVAHVCVCYYQCAYQVNCVARTATMLKINPRLSIDDLEALFELFVSILITYYYTRHIIVVVVGGVVSVAAAVVVLFCLLKTNVAFIVFSIS